MAKRNSKASLKQIEKELEKAFAQVLETQPLNLWPTFTPSK